MSKQINIEKTILIIMVNIKKKNNTDSETIMELKINFSNNISILLTEPPININQLNLVYLIYDTS